MGGVDFVPGIMELSFVEAGLDLAAACEGDVRVLPSPDHEEFALDFSGAGEGVVVFALAEGFGVQVGGVEAGGGLYVLL